MRPLDHTDPRTIGPYRLLAEIGRGGMGRVLLGASPDGRLVAQACTHELQTFLSRTFATVPVGTESAHLDVDGIIAGLLGSTTE